MSLSDGSEGMLEENGNGVFFKEELQDSDFRATGETRNEIECSSGCKGEDANGGEKESAKGKET